MAGYPATLFVQASFPPEEKGSERLEHKLQIHFQSQKRSGGGECEVRVLDRERDLYLVQFQSEEVKKQVKTHEPHFIEVFGRSVKINILSNSEVSMIDMTETSLANYLKSSAASSLSASSTLPLPNDFGEQNMTEKYAGDLESMTRKIFLSVSATLNTELLTKEQRNQVTTVFPTLKIDVRSGQNGIEKVSGDYDDIEKLHRHFEKLLGGPHHYSNEFSHRKGPKTMRERPMDDWKEGRMIGKKNDVDVSDIKVPSAIFEYFSQACKEQVDELEQKFSVKLSSEECGNGLASLHFSSVGDPSHLEKAQYNFVTAFQKVTADLKQEKINFVDSHQVAKAQQILNLHFKSVLTKTKGNTLILRGPAKEISAAKDAIGELEAGESVKTPDTYSFKTDHGFDLKTFTFLQPELSKEIKFINQKYNTEALITPDNTQQKVYVFFKNKMYPNSNPSLQAYKSFVHFYQVILDQRMEKVIPLNLEDQKRKLDKFFSALQKENPRVLMRISKKNNLILFGIPEDVLSFEKHIMWFLGIAVDPPAGNIGPSSSSGETKGAYLEQNGAPKMFSPPPREQKESKEMEVKQEDMCSICRDTIHHKKVLPKCKHEFCTECIEQALQYKPVCPVCNVAYGKVEGNQPPGTMNIQKYRTSLPGYAGYGTIEISYNIPNGIQTERHPSPGRPFSGAYRTAYLPDNPEGREILKLLQRAFDQKLIFTVGQSRTTGATNVVTWNDIHHKTSCSGGASSFGYPDPDYLKRVREELKAKGIE